MENIKDLSITGSLQLNQFEIHSVKERVNDILDILSGIVKLSIFFTESKDSIKVIVKSVVEIKDKRKCLRYHCSGEDKYEALDTALNYLGRKYFKLASKGRSCLEAELLDRAS